MFANEPTWTTERLERLRIHFDAGLSCREIAVNIGVSRNAVIGKLSRLGLTRGDVSAEPRLGKRERAAKSTPRLQYQLLRSLYEDGQPALIEPIASEHRCFCWNSARKNAAGRSARRALRIFAFAAMRRSKARPIAPDTTASPIVPARASGSRADR